MSGSDQQEPLRLAYYADDFTGATDALERLELAGVHTLLFMRPPTRQQLAKCDRVQAIGVAGVTRSLATKALEAEIAPTLQSLKSLGAQHVHYKVCSTFDSSPAVGSIGRVVELADQVFQSPFVPVVVGAPALGRWCVFGNLFASFGIGSDTPAYRLDRHPSMSQHPVTPADEADLTLHLAKQTDLPIRLFDVRALTQPFSAAVEQLKELLAQQPRIVLFDSMTDEHLAVIGKLTARYAAPGESLFWVGSSAVESALCMHWNEGATQITPVQTPLVPQGPVLVLAGSCSPVTRQQIELAKQRGTIVLTVDPQAIVPGSVVSELSASIVGHMQQGSSVVLTTMLSSNADATSLPAETLGTFYSQLLLSVLRHHRPALLMIAGGDTSSHTASMLPIDFFQFHAPLTPGAPVCQVASANQHLHGLHIVFKGGQVGRPELLAELTSPAKVNE